MKGSIINYVSAKTIGKDTHREHKYLAQDIITYEIFICVYEYVPKLSSSFVSFENSNCIEGCVQ